MRKFHFLALAKLVKMSLNTTNQYIWAKALKVVGYLFNERAKARSYSLCCNIKLPPALAGG